MMPNKQKLSARNGTNTEEVREISLVKIVVPKHRARRLRNVTPLVASIAQAGLIEPIVVRRLQDGRLVLVCGAHRLEAHRQLGRDTILARIIEVSDLQAELMELDENLMRTELTMLERGEHMLRRKDIHEQLYPETKHGGAPGKKGGGKKAKDATVASFAEDTAAKTGLSIRTIQEDVKIARLGDDTKKAIRGTPLEDQKRVLLQITRIAPEKQAAVAEAVASGQCRTVKQAVIELGVKETPQPRHPRSGIASLVRGVVEPLLDAKKRLARLAAGLDTASAQEARALGEEISAIEKKLSALATSVEARTAATRDAQVQGQRELPPQRPDTSRVDVLAAVQALFELESEGILKAPPMTAVDALFMAPSGGQAFHRQLAEVKALIARRTSSASRTPSLGRGTIPANDVLARDDGKLLPWPTFIAIQSYLERCKPTLERLYTLYAALREEDPRNARIYKKLDRFFKNGGSALADDGYIHYLKAHCADPQSYQTALQAMGQEMTAYLQAMNRSADKVLQGMGRPITKRGSAPAAKPAHAAVLASTQPPKQPAAAAPPVASPQALPTPTPAPAASTQVLQPAVPVTVKSCAEPDRPHKRPSQEQIEEVVSQLLDDLQSGRLRRPFEAEMAIRQKNWSEVDKNKAHTLFVAKLGKLPTSPRLTSQPQSTPAPSVMGTAVSGITSEPVQLPTSTSALPATSTASIQPTPSMSDVSKTLMSVESVSLRRAWALTLAAPSLKSTGSG
ncbi:ParB/RepB/Spo0J family partition protein [Polyangium mundeleinium]|uniref:ParB N-terminal domain-containing protein n=1 Tax=Polyangium mundeleinium TaxID=2995306 RepID=A0ABT5EN18_9BACT|nr:ParB N-terminal domain-containing protein [Polyangium mundeleinium]MDC0743233.1 ParB N-terminal domain-containing protein [Polyangium mundeleinium]